MHKKMLVTTALECTWGNEEEIIFIGEWCKPYNRKEYIDSKTQQTLSYHWSDTEKMFDDYEYMGDLYERMLFSVGNFLNKYHNTNKSLRYWRIVIGPWLYTFIPMVWDRWENLRCAINVKSQYKTITLHDSLLKYSPVKGYQEFMGLRSSHLYNHKIFADIIRYYYSNSVEIEFKSKCNENFLS